MRNGRKNIFLQLLVLYSKASDDTQLSDENDRKKHNNKPLNLLQLSLKIINLNSKLHGI